MTAEDYETHEYLINPYIVISRGAGKGCFLNTSTFKFCQDHLIHPLDDERLTPLIRSRRYYVVEAVVGEYNGAIPQDDPVKLLLRTVSVGRRERSRTLLGYLDESTVKDNLPKVFASLNEG